MPPSSSTSLEGNTAHVAERINNTIGAEALAGKQFAVFACEAGSGAEKAFVKLAKSLGVEGFGNMAERTGRTDDGGKNHGEHC